MVSNPLVRCALFALSLAPLGAAGFAFADEVNAVERSTSPDRPATVDALFAPSGRFAGTAASGLPFYAIGELSFGVTGGFTVGLMGGVSPDTQAVGLRLRGVIASTGSNRVYVMSPILYYPGSNLAGGEQWILAMPSLFVEHRFQGGASAHLGAGVAAADCLDALGSLVTHGRLPEEPGHSGFMGDVWATATVGGALPIGKSTSLFADAQVISQGLVFGRHWVGLVPVIATFGIHQVF